MWWTFALNWDPAFLPARTAALDGLGPIISAQSGLTGFFSPGRGADLPG